MKRRHSNIPIFIPHLGCPNDCAFCNQRCISGRSHFNAASIGGEIETALATLKDVDAEIAFFGGSFTGIDRALMVSLLDTAEDFVKQGRVTGIRLSTRPDYIDEAVLTVLKRYTVSQVELGIQSMDERVLAACRRGHGAEDTVHACRLLQEYGFSFVGQMMTGLPQATKESERATAMVICDLGAEAARIYPTVVLKGTHLAAMAERGEYRPMTEEEAIYRTADVLSVFRERGVKVLRIGLHAGEELTSGDEIACGFYHPAMGELVEGELYYRRLASELRTTSALAGKAVVVTVPKGELSKAIGQKGRNRERLIREFSLSSLRFVEGDKELKMSI